MTPYITHINLNIITYPDSKVNYLVADLFDYPQDWFENYDLVYECNSIQVLPGKYRQQALNVMVSLITENDQIIVSCRILMPLIPMVNYQQSVKMKASPWVQWIC